MRRTLIFITILTLLAGLLGYNYFFEPFKNLQWAQPIQVQPEPTVAPVEVTNEDLLFEALSPHDRVAQLLAVPLTVPADVATTSAELNWIHAHRPGFVTLFGTQVSREQAADAVTQIRSRYTATLSAMIAVDHEGGTVQRLSGSGFTRLPAWNTLCTQTATASAELLTTSAAELKEVGIDLVFAPVVDVGVVNTPLTSRICSHEPQLVSNRAEELVTIYQRTGITPVLKHFPGIGKTSRDLHFVFDRVTIAEGDTQPYLKILSTHPTIGVGVTHVGVTNQDPDVPCSLSASCVGQLRANYPQVLVFTDALEMKAAEYQVGTTEPKSLTSRVREAVIAGNDVLVFGEGISPETLDILINELETAYDQSPTFKAQVDASVKKIIHFKVKQR